MGKFERQGRTALCQDSRSAKTLWPTHLQRLERMEPMIYEQEIEAVCAVRIVAGHGGCVIGVIATKMTIGWVPSTNPLLRNYACSPMASCPWPVPTPIVHVHQKATVISGIHEPKKPLFL